MKLKKVLAIGLSSTMLLSAVPGTVFADEAEIGMEENTEEDSLDVEVTDEEPVSEVDVQEETEDTEQSEAEFVDTSDAPVQDDSEEEALSDSSFSDGETDSIIAQGKLYYDSVIWVLYADGTMEFSGRGGIDVPYSDEFDGYVAPWKDYRENTRKVIIDDGIDSIGEGGLFRGCTNLTEVSIPDTVESYGMYTFADCTSLESITIPAPENGEEPWIVGYLFSGCTNLKNVQLPDNITSICTSMFENCTSLADIQIPSGVTRISSSAFSGCTSLTHINIPSGVTELYDRVFRNCTSLTDIQIPSGVTSIGIGAFEGCTALENVNIPEQITKIENGTFEGCTSLRSIQIPEGVTCIEQHAFENCSSLETVSVPGSVVNIEQWAFYSSGLKSLEIRQGTGETTIGEDAFGNCRQLESIDLAGSVTIIENYAFSWCDALTSIKLGEGLKSIGDWVFDLSDKVTDLELPDSVENIGRYTFGSKFSVTLPAGLKKLDAANVRVVRFKGTEEQWNALLQKCDSWAVESYNSKVKVYFDYAAGEHQHDYIDYVIKQASCKNNTTGERQWKCGLCGEVRETEVIQPEEGHSWIERKNTPATCTGDGHIVYSCYYCGIRKEETIPAKGHTAVTDAGEAATCTNPGKTEGSHCSVCNAVLKEQETIPAKGHTVVTDAAVAATCTKAGKTKGSHCSVCKKVLVAQKAVPAKGHKYSAWKRKTEATVFTAEVQKRTCSGCGRTETRTGQKLRAAAVLSVSSLPLKTQQKTTVLRVTGLAKGDSVASWVSGNPKLIKVSGRANGTCTVMAGTRTGKTTITIKMRSGLRRVVTVYVQKGTVRTQRISGIAKSITMKSKQRAAFCPVITPLTSSERITYRSSNSRVAAVNSRGQITAGAKGTAVITVTSGSKSVRCKVTVK